MNFDMNILLVEDNDVDAAILMRSLRKMGAKGTVVRARDGIEALEILENDRIEKTMPDPYAILLDINMPRMNGHEFLSALRQNNHVAHAHARVFVFSTSDCPADVARAYRNNICGYIVKPDSLSELTAKMSTLRQFWEACAHPSPDQV